MPGPLYVEHQFLDEDEADAFLTTLPTGTSSKEEVREVTDQLLDDQEGGSSSCTTRGVYKQIHSIPTKSWCRTK